MSAYLGAAPVKPLEYFASSATGLMGCAEEPRFPRNFGHLKDPSYKGVLERNRPCALDRHQGSRLRGCTAEVLLLQGRFLLLSTLRSCGCMPACAGTCHAAAILSAQATRL